MTTEEKAKAYEMALEGARKELGVDRKEWEVVQQVLHNIFPELAESEDERIRKKLIKVFSRSNPKDTWADTGIEMQEIITYLEKQKEQNPAERFAEAREKYQVEWSKDDEAAYDAFMCEVVNEKMNPTIEEVNWLRGIRDRLKSLRPSWKPSEEQMKALEKAIIRVHSDDEIPILTELRQQLKKLI